MIQIHAQKVCRMIGEGMESKDIASKFNDKYTVKEIDVFRPKKRQRKRATKKG